MLKWRDHASDFLEAAGCDVGAVHAKAQMLVMLAEVPEGHVFRVRDGDNAVWCRLCADDTMTCVAIAPWGSVHDNDTVGAAEFFHGAAWPDTWTWWHKREGLKSAREGMSGWRADEPQAGGFAWRVASDGAKVQIAHVVDVGPLIVAEKAGEPPRIAEGETWRALPAKHDAGMRLVWEAGYTLQPSAGMACSWAARYAKAAQSSAEKEAEKAARKAAGPSEAQKAARAKWQAAMAAGKARKAAEKAAGIQAAKDEAARIRAESES